jgi:hypothetical protein
VRSKKTIDIYFNFIYNTKVENKGGLRPFSDPAVKFLWIFTANSRMEGFQNEKNLSAQEASAQDGARLPQENVHFQRAQGARAPQSQGQKAAFRLIRASEPLC